MKKGLSEIVLLLDRSGSMDLTKSDAEGGLRSFIEKQKVLPGECELTFYRFDDEIELVFDARPLRLVNPEDLKLEPRGWTALLDAMAKVIDEVGKRLSLTPEDLRPERVYFVTVTDGLENWSKMNTRATVNARIKRQREEYNWEFIYIGANQDAIAEASSLGIPQYSSLTYSGSQKSYVNMYSSLNNSVSTSRLTGEVACFNATDRESAMEK